MYAIPISEFSETF